MVQAASSEGPTSAFGSPALATIDSVESIQRPDKSSCSPILPAPYGYRPMCIRGRTDASGSRVSAATAWAASTPPRPLRRARSKLSRPPVWIVLSQSNWRRTGGSGSAYEARMHSGRSIHSRRTRNARSRSCVPMASMHSPPSSRLPTALSGGLTRSWALWPDSILGLPRRARRLSGSRRPRPVRRVLGRTMDAVGSG